jgi:hypothetical protein
MSKTRILAGSLFLAALLAINFGLLSQFGASGVPQVQASSKIATSPVFFPLVKPLGSVSAPTGYLHIFDGARLTGCDLYIPGGTNLPNLGNFTRCGLGSWDNAISSFDLGNGVAVRFYTDYNYTGRSEYFVGPGYALTMGADWDNQISSLKVYWGAAPAP